MNLKLVVLMSHTKVIHYRQATAVTAYNTVPYTTSKMTPLLFCTGWQSWRNFVCQYVL